MKKQMITRYLNCLRPALIKSLNDYNLKIFNKDIISGIIVGIIALPLSLALAIASGAPPEIGLITAIIGGGIAAMLSGSKVQVSGPTAAFIPIVLSIAVSCGPEGFLAAVFLAGAILLVMGFLRLGKLINYISLPIIAGFTSGIAVSIFSSQISDLMGYDYNEVPREFLHKISFYITQVNSVNIYALLIGVICLVIMLVLPRVSKKIPAALVAILFAVAVQRVFMPPISTIGSRFGELQLAFKFRIISFDNLSSLIIPAFSIALLAAIESLLSAKAADNMIKSVHNPNAELISQGAANIATSLFGGLPVTGAIARTSANIKNGGLTPVSAIVHVLTVLIIGLILMPFAVYIPLTALSAVLLIVCKNMLNIKEAKKIIYSTPRDIMLFFTALILTVIFDLVVAILAGMSLALISLMINYIVFRVKKQEYRPQILVEVEEDECIVKFIGTLNFISDSTFKINEIIPTSKHVVIDLYKALDMDIQGYMVIIQLIKIMILNDRCVKVIGNNKCIKYLYNINIGEKDELDLTEILIEQSMLTFNKI